MSTVRAPDERKLVTVLFADLVRSTQLVAEHDAEDVRAMLHAFFEEMAREIRAFGGTVEKYAGDAVMAVFGVPRVYEDDAERAVRAAAAMQESLAQLNPAFERDYGVCLELRVGIASGEAVAASGPQDQFLVTGEVATLAARLQSAAPGILISADTHRFLAPLLDVERLDGLSLKGFEAPVTAYRLRALRATDSRPRGIPGLSSPLVGRDAELRALHECVAALRRGRGQIVSIVGEAGIGKSRLKSELRDSLGPEARWLEGRCHAYTETTSYAPVIQVLRAVFRLSGAEPRAIARTKLRATLRELVGEREGELQHAVAHLLGVDLGSGRVGDGALDPRALQSQLLVAGRVLVEALATRQPLVLAVEDIHWADAASVELLTILLELTDFAPLLVLVTSRPDTDGRAWELRFHAQRNYPHRLTEIALAPLAPADTEQLTGNLLHVRDLPERLARQILDRSEGNPFFLEEILRTLIERGTLAREGDRWIAREAPERIAMPDTLRGVIAARIDALPSTAKIVLQRASVVGRFFGYRVLQSLGNGADGLDRALALLLRGELIREWARLPEREYLFKHALTQEAAYASLLGEERRRLHRQVAEHLERSLEGVSEEHSAFLAHHWLRAEDWERALHYTLLAAERARRLYARPEAVAHYWHALDLLGRLPATPERRRTRIDVVLVLLELPGWRRNQAEQAAGFEHLDSAMLGAAESGDAVTLARLEAMSGILRHNEEALRRALERAEASRNAAAMAYVADEYGGYLGQEGRYEASLGHTGRAIELLGADGDRYGQAMQMAGNGRCYSSRAGRFEEASRYAARVREIAEELGDARLRAWRAMEAEVYMYQGAWADVVRVAEEALPGAWEIGEINPILFVSGWLGIAYVKLGRPDDARRVVDRALREGRARVGVGWQLSWPELATVQLHLSLGETDAAREAAQRALQLVEGTHHRLEHGAALRALGQALELGGDTLKAEAAFAESLSVLEGIESRPELAQTVLAYGRFKMGTDLAAGRALVERALRMFEEMDAAGWATEARTALG
jgi:predicted ATPase/class 3 adenylate cyclase